MRLRERQIEYLKTIEAIVQAKVKIVSCSLPTIIISESGKIEYIYDEKTKEALRLAEDMMEEIRTKIFNA